MPLKDRQARAEYNRAYRDAHREILNAYKRQWFKERYAADEEYRQRIRGQTRIPAPVHAAQQRLQRALRTGKMQRPTVCPECGRDVFVEAAHINYTENLAVRWMCRSCHRRWDKAEPKYVRREDGETD